MDWKDMFVTRIQFLLIDFLFVSLPINLSLVFPEIFVQKRNWDFAPNSNVLITILDLHPSVNL